MLNILWPLFIIISIIYSILTGRIEQLNNSIFESTKNVIDFLLTLIGMTCLWSGIMEIASNTKMIDYISKLLKPVINLLFPNLNEKTRKDIIMNIVANILGLGNAATPLGLKAMDKLQKDNKDKNVLSDHMMMLIVLNAASLQVIPTTVLAIRSSYGSESPSSIIVPIWISSICAAIVGVVVTKILINITRG